MIVRKAKTTQEGGCWHDLDTKSATRSAPCKGGFFMKNLELSLGHSVIQSYQMDGQPLLIVNLVGPDYQTPLPTPEGDGYLQGLAVPAIRSGETVICHRLIEGLYGYYKGKNLIPEDASVIQVETEVGEDVIFGYPFMDPLEILRGKVTLHSDNQLVLVPSLSGVAVEAQARDLGLSIVPLPQSVDTNNKTKLRLAVDRYGIKMLPGEILASKGDVEEIASRFKDFGHGVWIKFPTGSGGDLVQHITPVTEETLFEGINVIRNSVLKAFKAGRFPLEGDEFWPADMFAPAGFDLVVESDARNHGQILVNGSDHFITDRSGGINILGKFRQIISEDGEFLGSRSYYPEDKICALLDESIRAAGRYNITENGYYGIQGTDWFLISIDGEPQVYTVELNSRPIVSTYPAIIAQKLEAKHWINTNVYTQRPISIDDYVAVIGADLAHGFVKDGLVIPLAFRTLSTRRRTIPSPNFKIMILGSDSTHCDDIFNQLKNRGIRFSP